MMVTDPCQHLEMEMACDANKIRSDLFIRPRYWLVASLVLTDLVCRNCWGGEGGGTNGSIGGSPEVIAPSFVSDDAHKISWQLAEKCRARICYDAILRRITLQFPKAASL